VIRLASLIALGWLSTFPVGTAQTPGRIRLYTYSRDSAAGFKDERLDLFRRELGRYVEDFSEVAYTAESAQASIQLLGPGVLSVALGLDGKTEHHLFTPDEEADRTWVVIRVGTFAKELSVEGSGGRDLARLAKAVSDWISDNRTAIRERALARD
jgi:hypothetical protein